MNFTKLTQYLDSLCTDPVPGCDMAVSIAHEPVFRHFTGLRDRETGAKMTGEECYWLYSATKVITCVSAMQLVEQGRLFLEDPVGKYLPAYNQLSIIRDGVVGMARNVLRVKHLFTMQGGLNYDLNSPSILNCNRYRQGRATTREMADAIAEEPLTFEPGTHYQYSLCHDVLAAIVEVISGMPFGEYLKKNVFTPLGMKDTGFVLTPEREARMAKQYLYDDESKTVIPHPQGLKNVYQISPAYESGGAGLISTVSDYILFAEALANDGIGRTGEAIISRKSIDMMRVNRQGGACMTDFGKPGYGYGLGVRTRVDTKGSRCPLGEFGWDGAACAYTLIDADNHISIFYAQHTRNFHYGYDVIHPTIREMVYEIVEG